MKFDIMDQVLYPPRYNELARRFQEGIASNQEWYLEYIADREPGTPLPYHENLGLSALEYAEFMELTGNLELVSSGSAEYDITHTEHTIELVPVDTLQFKAISINFTQNTVSFDGQLLAFSDTVRISDPQNGLKSEWAGYTWVYENPADLDISALTQLQSLELQQYKCTIGYLERYGQTYLQIKGREMANGVFTLDYEFPLLGQ